MVVLLQDLMVATGEITGFDLAKKKVEICTKKGEFNEMLIVMKIIPLKMVMMMMRWVVQQS